ncbi:MAG: tetratricopeptide repeat protein [Chthoniobacteraceae bacterium]
MRQFVLFVIAFVTIAANAADAQSSDPGDLFVSAYMAVQAGEKAEQAGNFKEATSKFRYAAQVLDQISERHPTWQPSIIEYRKKRTSEAITRMQDKIGRVGGGKGEAPSTAVAPPASAPPGGKSILPGLPDEILPSTPPSQPRRGATDSRAIEPELPASTPGKELEQRMETLQAELKKVRAAAAQAEREKADLAVQLQQATAAREAADKKQAALSQRALAAEDALRKAQDSGQSDTDQTRKLAAELLSVKKQLRDMKFDADAEAEYRQQLADRVRATQAKISRLSVEKAAAEKESADVPGKIAAYEKQLEESRKEKNDLVIKLSRTETDLKSATASRDEALAQVVRMKEAQKQVDKLLSDNATLMAKLGEAEKSILQFKADGEKKDGEIASLRKETTSLKDQLARAQKESVEYQTQMADLQQRLSQANSQIAEMKTEGTKSAAERTRLLDENQVLRGIVLRGQKEEARRSQTKKLVLSELGKLENKSKVLMDQIEFLSGPIVKLTEKERALFKKPELQISDSEIAVAAARPEPAPATSVEPPLPTAAPAAAPAETKASPTVSNSTPAPKTADVKSTPPAAAPTTAPAVTSTEKPALSLDTGVRTLAKNSSPFSNLPDGLTPKATEKAAGAGIPPLAKATTPKPAAAPDSDLPTKMPEKAPASSSGPAENPLASGASSTENINSATMNLPPELAADARQGKDEFDKGNYRDAERLYEKVLAKAPNNLYTLSNLGVVYFRGQKYKRAEEMFKKAIAIAPEDGFSHCTLGIVYYSQQKYDEAVNELTKALAINPKNATAHNYLGITASQKGWQEAAQKELETATTLDPTYADAHFNLAVVFATQQPPNKENARRCYKRATELGAEPDSALEQMIK